MKIIHTGDWHLGKNLEGYTRIDEQKLFLDELCDICDDNEIDILIVAGDIYDNSNPSADAEKLFYYYMKKLSNNGQRAIIIISGNHDSSSRLASSSPLAKEFGIIIEATPKTVIESGKYGDFTVSNVFEGGFEIQKNSEKAVFLTMPYPSEKNINEIISEEFSENEFQQNYSDKIASIFKERERFFRDDTVNIVVGHFFISGGTSSDSERNIQLGGSYAVDSNVFPEKTQYVAMGHLHRPQHIKTNVEHSYYAGSPIQYSKSEIGYAKSVYMIDIKSNSEPVVEKFYLHNYKPIEVWKANSIEDAIALCDEQKDKNCFVFLEVKTERVFLQSEIKQIKSLKKDIVEIRTILSEKDDEVIYYEEDDDKSISEQFKDFYQNINGVLPTDEVTELFLDIIKNVEEGEWFYETNNA